MTRQIEAGIVCVFTLLKGIYFYLRSWTVTAFWEQPVLYFTNFMHFSVQCNYLSFIEAICGEILTISDFRIRQEKFLKPS